MALIDVSGEIRDRLDKYRALLVKWQARINLVASDSLSDAWDRHFIDSLQLVQFLPTGKFILADIGTGAGFPGLVLAIARPDIQVHLVESDAKKCEFLKTVSRETATPVLVHTDRIEKLPPFPVDIMTARALAPLVELFKYALPYATLNPNLKMIFLKGAQAQDEITVARDVYDFTIESHESLTSSAGHVLIISQLNRK